MKVGYITQWFWPEPVPVPMQYFDALQSAGFDVTVLTGVPNFPEGRVHSGYRSSRYSTDRRGPAQVIRAPLYPSHDRSALRRILNYLSWGLGSVPPIITKMRTTDVNLVYGSPATAAIPALAARLVSRTPFVFVVQDLWPEAVTGTGLLRGRRLISIVDRVLQRAMGFLYQRAAAVVVISEGMKRLLIDRGVRPDKISLVYNWAANESRVVTWEEDPPEELVVMYAGNHGAAQGLDSVIRAVGRLQHEFGIRLVLVGDGVMKDELRNLANAVAPQAVEFRDSVSSDEMPRLMKSACVQLVSLAPGVGLTATIPSKLQTILAAGEAVICIASGDASEIVRSAEAGWTAQPGDVDSITEALRLAKQNSAVLSHHGANARRFYDLKMSSDIGKSKLAAVVRRVAEDAREGGDQRGR